MEYWFETTTPLLQYPIQFCLFVIARVNCNHLSSAFSYSALVMNYLASDEGQKEVLNIDKPPALPKFQPDYLRGVNLFPADWTLSDGYDEYNKLYREIFWKGN